MATEFSFLFDLQMLRRSVAEIERVQQEKPELELFLQFNAELIPDGIGYAIANLSSEIIGKPRQPDGREK